MTPDYNDDDPVPVGTLLHEARQEDRHRANQHQAYLEDLVLISRFCQVLEEDGHPITHIQGPRGRVSIDDIRARVNEYALMNT